MSNQQRKPNVIYITTHDQGIAAACYAKYGPGASLRMVTPNIDELASRGAMLTQHFGTAPQCSPARGTLITGKYPHVNGLVGLAHRGFSITEPNKTVLHHFKNNGYTTRLIGFQHEIRRNPQDLGYETVLPKRPFVNCHELIPDIDLSFREFSNTNNQGKPFWLSIGAKEVHLNWGVHSRRSNWPSPNEVDVPAYLPDTKKTRKHIRKFYGDLNSYDRFLGKIWDMLDKYNLRDNTIIVVTTDHGIAHPRSKGTLYDPGNHNLMIWSGPAIPKGKKIHSLLSSIDFASTICDMCGLDPHEEFMGLSYKSALTSAEQTVSRKYHDYVFTELSYHDIYNPMRAIRSEKYKLIVNYEPGIQLIDSIPRDIRHNRSYKEWRRHGTNTTRQAEEFYDLEGDPLELENILIEHPNHPEYIKSKSALGLFLEETDDPIRFGPYPCPPGARMDPVKKT